MTGHIHHHRNCIAVFEKLSEYLDRELDRAGLIEMENHLRDCTPCQVCLETLRRTVSLCGNLKRDPVPESFSQRLREMIADEIKNIRPPDGGAA
jgi:anti-sigma factor RsiW